MHCLRIGGGSHRRSLVTVRYLVKEMKTVKRLFKVLGLALAIYIAYFLFSLATAENRVRTICAGIKPGTTVSQLEQISKDNRMSKPTDHGGFGYMVERRSYGRYGCRITFSYGVVAKAEYSHQD